MRQIGTREIRRITLGATVLASGGGGDPYIGSVMAQQAVEQHGPIRLISVDDLSDDALYVTVGMIGAPTVMLEKLPSGTEAIQACRSLERHLGRKIAGIYPIEAGGINSLLPLVIAAQLQLPVVDMDGMGRAFPELQMTTFHLHGVNFSPMAVVDEKGNESVIAAKDSIWAERLARAACSAMGGAAIFAGCTVSGAMAKKAGIRDIFSLEMRIGETMESARERGANVVDELFGLLKARRLFHGKVIDVERRTDGGFSRGIARLEGLGEDSGHAFDLQFQNEFLLARVDGEIACVTPDLISLVDEETGMPILAERLRYGARLIALGIPANPLWRTPMGINVAGPRYFKYDADFTPVETISRAKVVAI